MTSLLILAALSGGSVPYGPPGTSPYAWEQADRAPPSEENIQYCTAMYATPEFAPLNAEARQIAINLCAREMDQGGK
jgi:hypothetical protein